MHRIFLLWIIIVELFYTFSGKKESSRAKREATTKVEANQENGSDHDRPTHSARSISKQPEAAGANKSPRSQGWHMNIIFFF